MKKILLMMTLLVLFITACSKKPDEPISIIKEFILLCEEGNLDGAKKLLAPKNNVDYFKKFKDYKKDLIYIDYDYKGNDDTVELKFEKIIEKSDENSTTIKMTSNYKKQNHTFDKEIILHKINNQWKIYEFIFLPVVVK